MSGIFLEFFKFYFLVFNALQVVLYETNNLLDWEEYYNEATKEEENNKEEKEKEGEEEKAWRKFFFDI